MGFPKDFIWGASAASYQVEGGANVDGRGPSVWDMLCRQPGRIWNGDTGDVGCDHYHHVDEDTRLMGEIGLHAYRLSISWPRILPEGTGAVNARGLDFYDRLIDALLARKIQPWVTLFHWDYPLALYHRGGWLSPDSPKWFADYAAIVVDKISDRVGHWMTQNEPQCYLGLGLRDGIHAPGDKLGLQQVLLANHHSLLAHGLAAQVIRGQAKTTPLIGAAPVGVTSIPATDSPADIEAARRRMFSITAPGMWNNTLFTDPMFFGTYPDDAFDVFGKDMPAIGPDDMATIHQPLDFFGANIYNGATVRADGQGGIEEVKREVGHALTHMDWPVTPKALYWGPRFFHERYRVPIVITENGLASCDWVAVDGQVHDPQRIDFLTRYLREYRRASEDGVPVLGYFQWSIMDNFEWTFGYARRFGLIYVDYPTGKRIPKDSARWYAQVIATNGECL